MEILRLGSFSFSRWGTPGKGVRLDTHHKYQDIKYIIHSPVFFMESVATSKLHSLSCKFYCWLKGGSKTPVLILN